MQGQWKTYWKERKTRGVSFFCPLCRIPRTLPFQPQMTTRHYLQIFLTTLMGTLVTWPWLKLKGIVFGIPCWILFESALRWRKRIHMVCPQCGFDPYLFCIQEDLAKQAVEDHWKKKFHDAGMAVPDPATQASLKRRQLEKRKRSE